MSSGSPNQPGKGPVNPNNLGRYGPRILLGGLALGITYTWFVTRAPKPEGTPMPNPLRTVGVQNIEGAYQSGGATSTHTKAYGGTPQGQKEDVGRMGDGQFGTNKEKGLDSQEGLGDDQRPGSTNKVGEKFKDMKYGVGKDK